jgi:hypothetical protein
MRRPVSPLLLFTSYNRHWLKPARRRARRNTTKEKDTEMDQPKPSEAIAARFKISVESARYFLGRVQKSFKGAKPPQQLIADFMKSRHFKTLPEPYELARMLHESGQWEQALQTEPPARADEPDIYF